MEHTYHPDDGAEVMEPDNVDIGTLAVLNKSEIDQQVATAKKYPRSIVKFRQEALQLATLDDQTAAECIYALPRDGKVIEGPSARFAEIMAYSWGNSRAGARVIGEDAEFVTSQGLYFDLEKNVAISYEVKRRITGKSGKRYSADMIGTTSNAASSIALRNAVLKGVPKALWRPIYDACRKVVAGDFKTLVNRREAALQAFVIYGVTPDMIFKTLGIGGKEDIGLDQLVVLSGFLTALKDGESSVDDIFGNVENHVKGNAARVATNQKTSSIVDKYQKPAEAAAAQPQQQPERGDAWEPTDAENPSQAPEKTAQTTAQNAEHTESSQPSRKPDGHRQQRDQATPGMPLSFDGPKGGKR